jgi:hypothetical protein
MVSYKEIPIIILSIIFIIVIPATAATTGTLLWSKSLVSPVNTIDTSESGKNIFVGLEDGRIISYNSDGYLVWELNLNGSIKKLKTISDGSKVIAMNNQNQSYYIDGVNGNVIKTIYSFPHSYIWNNNITDVGISRDGKYFAIAGVSGLIIYDSNGTPYASNLSFSMPWSKIAFDPYSNWTVAVSKNKTFKWNVSSYIGWPEMNYYKDTRNASNIRDDGFPYKINYITSTTGSYQLSFIPNVSTIGLSQYYNNFWYNRSITGNLSIRDSNTLVDIVSATNSGQGMLNYTIISGHSNVSIYYGNMSYRLNGYGVIP